MYRQRLSGYCCSPTVAISLLFTKHCDQTDCSSSSRVVAGRGHRDNVPMLHNTGLGWDTLFDCVQWCPHHPVQCSVPGATDNSVECGEGKKWLPFDYLNTEHCSYGELKSQQSAGYINTHTAVTFVNNRQLFRYIFANRFVSIITLCNIEFKLSMNRIC